jgi:hypothetical protein
MVIIEVLVYSYACIIDTGLVVYCLASDGARVFGRLELLIVL